MAKQAKKGLPKEFWKNGMEAWLICTCSLPILWTFQYGHWQILLFKPVWFGFQINELPFIVILSLVGLALAILPVFTGKKHGNSFLSVYLPLLVSAVAFGVCFIFVLQARSYLIGTLWATQLDASNPDAVAAMNTGAPSFIMFVVSMVIITVSSFFSFTKGEKVEEK